jgi:excisionase family DNA binding protein
VNAEPEPEVMNADQLAAFLGVNKDTVYDYANAGKIPHRRLGRRLLFSRAAILAWLQGNNARR